MYLVKVYQLQPYTYAGPVVKTRRKLVETKEFPYGTWVEIAYWLDDQGFISGEYEVNISFRRN